nr:unnamed protein product [uncultured bacterium]
MYYKRENLATLRQELIRHVGIEEFNKISATVRTKLENFEYYRIGYSSFWINKRTKAKVFSKSEILKSNDEHRPIKSPKKDLKVLTKEINELFSSFTSNRYYIKGFVKDEGVQTNAEYFRKYGGIKFGLNMDLENAFNQIDYGNLKDFGKIVMGWNAKVSEKFAKLLTIKGQMVQGNPLSPTMLNLFAIPMDLTIIEFSKSQTAPLLYTRYADDMLIGSRTKIDFKTFINLLKIIKQFGFKVKKKKTKFMKNNIEITGIILYNGKRWKTKRGRKRRLVKKIRLMKHLQSLGLKHTKRLNKEGKLIEISCVISGILAWLYPASSKKKKSRKNRKTKQNSKLNRKFSKTKHDKSLAKQNKKFSKDKRQKVAKNVEEEYRIFCMTNHHILRRNSPTTT